MEKYKIFDLGHLFDQVISHLQAVYTSGHNPGASLGTRIRGQWPGANGKIDHTEIKPGTYRYKYLLVFIDPFQDG